MGLSLLLLVGCSGAVATAEDEHRIAMKSAQDETERCAIDRKLAEAYLKAGNEDKYKNQKLAADITCQSARLGL